MCEYGVYRSAVVHGAQVCVCYIWPSPHLRWCPSKVDSLPVLWTPGRDDPLVGEGGCTVPCGAGSTAGIVARTSAMTLEMAFGAQPDTFAAFSQLASTCNSLPVDKLLKATALAICPDAEPGVQPKSGGFGGLWPLTRSRWPRSCAQAPILTRSSSCATAGAILRCEAFT